MNSSILNSRAEAAGHRILDAALRALHDLLRDRDAARRRCAILLGQAATPEAVAGLRTAMHLDQPAFLRFIYWLGELFTGDLGTSYVNKMPISDLIGGRLVNTLKLAGVTALISVPIALALGITAAIMRGTVYDRLVTILTICVISVPEFMVATLAVLLFAVYLGWLPALSMANEVYVDRRPAEGLCDAGDHAELRRLRTDDPHDPRRRARNAQHALCRDGSSERCIAPPHGSPPRASERARAHR